MKTKEKLIVLLIMVIAISMLIPTNAQAALQANGNDGTTQTLENWLLSVRQMEEAGGTLGLEDTINTSNLLSTATTPNNLDIHMQKNTEYGAMAILSASSYGNPSKINSNETTTGNKSGIYIYINKEWVSAGTVSNSSRYKGVNAKYKNIYKTSYAARIGDAITETNGWHGGSTTWMNVDYASGLIRANSGSLFSYYGYAGATNLRVTTEGKRG